LSQRWERGSNRSRKGEEDASSEFHALENLVVLEQAKHLGVLTHGLTGNVDSKFTFAGGCLKGTSKNQEFYT
jgi:hypothetical protein